MSTANCAKCNKPVYPTEKIQADKPYHRGCFRCAEPSCNITLNLKTFNQFEGNIYCARHVPQMKAHFGTADNLSISHALNAPKKTAEGLHRSQVGQKEDENNRKVYYGLDAMSNQHALNTPKKTAEGLHRTIIGDGQTSINDTQSVSTRQALNSPKKAVENSGHIQRGTNSAVNGSGPAPSTAMADGSRRPSIPEKPISPVSPTPYPSTSMSESLDLPEEQPSSVAWDDPSSPQAAEPIQEGNHSQHIEQSGY